MKNEKNWVGQEHFFGYFVLDNGIAIISLQMLVISY